MDQDKCYPISKIHFRQIHIPKWESEEKFKPSKIFIDEIPLKTEMPGTLELNKAVLATFTPDNANIDSHHSMELKLGLLH